MMTEISVSAYFSSFDAIPVAASPFPMREVPLISDRLAEEIESVAWGTMLLWV